MTGDEIIGREEVRLTTKKLITIALDELADYKNRRISRDTLSEVFHTFWRVVANELIQGNRVSTPLGRFEPTVDRRYGRANWVKAGVKRQFIPTKDRRIGIKFKPSKLLLNSMHHLIEVFDAQQVNRNIQVVSRRRLVRNSRPAKRPSNAPVRNGHIDAPR